MALIYVKIRVTFGKCFSILLSEGSYLYVGYFPKFIFQNKCLYFVLIDIDIEHDENSGVDMPSSSSSSDSTPPTELKTKGKKKMSVKHVKSVKTVKPVKTRQIRQVFKIEDESLEESILEWMQIEEHDFLWNSQRTEYRFPDKKKAKFAEKEVAINLIHPELNIGGEYNIFKSLFLYF